MINAQSDPLVIGKQYTFYDGQNRILICEECDPIWDIKFLDNNNAILISRMPNKSENYGSCRSEVKYKYNSANKTVTILSISNNNVSSDCKNRFLGDWQWKKGKYPGMRFYSKNLFDCDFSLRGW